MGSYQQGGLGSEPHQCPTFRPPSHWADTGRRRCSADAFCTHTTLGLPASRTVGNISVVHKLHRLHYFITGAPKDIGTKTEPWKENYFCSVSNVSCLRCEAQKRAASRRFYSLYAGRVTGSMSVSLLGAPLPLAWMKPPKKL